MKSQNYIQRAFSQMFALADEKTPVVEAPENVSRKKQKFYDKYNVFLLNVLTKHILSGLIANCSFGFDCFQLCRVV